VDGNALEVALGLVRMPAMRGTLRLRPLPEDVGELIELAADVPRRVAEASVISGEPPDQVREAARFYVREVLLFPGADAYRILGVSETASAAQIKLHYWRLQHWLHPDRRGDGWESVFATRINQAWGELRSPARRAAYDARQARAAAPEVDEAPQRVVVGEWRPVPGDDPPQRVWRLPAAVIAGCAGLVLLLLFEGQAPAPEWDVQAERSTEAQAQTLATTADAAVEKLQARLSAATDVRTAKEPSPTPVAALADAVPLAGPVPQTATQQAGLEPGAASPALPSKDRPRPPPPQKPENSEVSRGEAAATDTALPPSPTKAAAVESTRNASTPVATPSPERLRLAQRRGQEVTRYLGNPTDQAPPIWHSVAALDEATELRERLDDGRSRLLRRVRFDDAQWRIGGENARMTAAIRRGSRAEGGMLQVDLVWRDGMWLVEHVEAEGL